MNNLIENLNFAFAYHKIISPDNFEFLYINKYFENIKGGDISKYCIKWNGNNWISYGDWLAAPRRKEFFTNKRILIREITNPNILASYTEDEFYNTPSIINIIEFKRINEKYLLAIINSNLLSFYHINTSPKAKKGLFPKILVNDVRNLPIKEISEQEQKPFIELVEQIMSLKSQGKDTTDLENKIDEMVYDLYELTEEEKEIVRNFKN